MTQPVPEPEPLSPLDNQFFNNWNELKKYEDAKYVIYGGVALLVAAATYIIFGLGQLAGLVDLATAGVIYVSWRWYCSRLTTRHRELYSQREEIRRQANSSPEEPTDD
jgi:hypothetical protein